jgi:hypothetical protein
VRRLQRDGLLTTERLFNWNWTRRGETVSSILIRTQGDHVILKYQHQHHGGPWVPMEYPVHLDWTPCAYGGQRAWFLCPAMGCGRRVALLYVGASGVFACRHCQRLAYASQRESAYDRAARRADTIRERLGWEIGILNPKGCKPKGMHWRTFERLTARHDAFASITLAGLVQRFRLNGDG